MAAFTLRFLETAYQSWNPDCWVFRKEYVFVLFHKYKARAVEMARLASAPCGFGSKPNCIPGTLG